MAAPFEIPLPPIEERGCPICGNQILSAELLEEDPEVPNQIPFRAFCPNDGHVCFELLYLPVRSSLEHRQNLRGPDNAPKGKRPTRPRSGIYEGEGIVGVRVN